MGLPVQTHVEGRDYFKRCFSKTIRITWSGEDRQTVHPRITDLGQDEAEESEFPSSCQLILLLA